MLFQYEPKAPGFSGFIKIDVPETHIRYEILEKSGIKVSEKGEYEFDNILPIITAEPTNIATTSQATANINPIMKLYIHRLMAKFSIFSFIYLSSQTFSTALKTAEQKSLLSP